MCSPSVSASNHPHQKRAAVSDSQYLKREAAPKGCFIVWRGLDVLHAPSHRVSAVLEKFRGGFDEVQAAFDVRKSRLPRRFDHLVDGCVEALALHPDHKDLLAVAQDCAARPEPHLIEVFHRGDLRPACFCVLHFVFLAFYV